VTKNSRDSANWLRASSGVLRGLLDFSRSRRLLDPIAEIVATFAALRTPAHSSSEHGLTRLPLEDVRKSYESVPSTARSASLWPGALRAPGHSDPAEHLALLARMARVAHEFGSPPRNHRRFGSLTAFFLGGAEAPRPEGM
jgi:hypothetical protein